MDLFKDIIASINNKSGNVFSNNPDEIESYVPMIVNKNFFYDDASILYANEANKCWHMPKQMQYDFYYHALDKKKRFNKWIKPEKDENFDVIKAYFNFSDTKTKEALRILKQHDIENIKQEMYTGD